MNSMLHSVLQDWVVERLTLKMQANLLQVMRGPDSPCPMPNVKEIVRWLRGIVLVPGDPGNIQNFMYTDLPPNITEKGQTAKELEFCTQHFYVHLMHALEIVGYEHPEKSVAERAKTLYSNMCKLMHLEVETKSEFEFRLKHLHWPNNEQPRTAGEAFDLLKRHGEPVQTKVEIAETIAKKKVYPDDPEVLQSIFSDILRRWLSGSHLPAPNEVAAQLMTFVEEHVDKRIEKDRDLRREQFNPLEHEQVK